MNKGQILNNYIRELAKTFGKDSTITTIAKESDLLEVSRIAREMPKPPEPYMGYEALDSSIKNTLTILGASMAVNSNKGDEYSINAIALANTLSTASDMFREKFGGDDVFAFALLTYVSRVMCSQYLVNTLTELIHEDGIKREVIAKTLINLPTTARSFIPEPLLETLKQFADNYSKSALEIARKRLEDAGLSKHRIARQLYYASLLEKIAGTGVGKPSAFSVFSGIAALTNKPWALSTTKGEMSDAIDMLNTIDEIKSLSGEIFSKLESSPIADKLAKDSITGTREYSDVLFSGMASVINEGMTEEDDEVLGIVLQTVQLVNRSSSKAMLQVIDSLVARSDIPPGISDLIKELKSLHDSSVETMAKGNS